MLEDKRYQYQAMYLFGPIVAGIFFLFFAYSPAQATDTCPELRAGDHIKVVGSPAIYALNADREVLYFPSGDVYKSWTSDGGYGSYVSISQECYDTLALPTKLPGGVNFRPGSYIVRREGNPQLYAVLPRNELAPIDDDVKQKWYGDSPVKEISALYWHNYTVISTPVSESLPPTGTILDYGDRYWYVDGAMVRPLIEGSFERHHFSSSFTQFVRPTTFERFIIGPSIRTFEPILADATQTDFSTPPTSVSITLAKPTIVGPSSAWYGLRGPYTAPYVTLAHDSGLAKVAWRVQLAATPDFTNPSIDFLSFTQNSATFTYRFGEAFRGLYHGSATLPSMFGNGGYYWRARIQDDVSNRVSEWVTPAVTEPTYAIDTSTVPVIDVHVLVLFRDQEVINKAIEQTKKTIAQLNHLFVSHEGELLVRFAIKDIVTYNDLDGATCDFVEDVSKESRAPTVAVFNKCPAGKIRDPKALNFVVFSFVDVTSRGGYSGGTYYSFVQMESLPRIYTAHHELGHAFGLPHVCRPAEAKVYNVMNPSNLLTKCAAGQYGPKNYNFDEKQTAIVKKRIKEMQKKFSL